MQEIKALAFTVAICLLFVGCVTAPEINVVESTQSTGDLGFDYKERVVVDGGFGRISDVVVYQTENNFRVLVSDHKQKAIHIIAANPADSLEVVQSLDLPFSPILLALDEEGGYLLAIGRKEIGFIRLSTIMNVESLLSGERVRTELTTPNIIPLGRLIRPTKTVVDDAKGILYINDFGKRQIIGIDLDALELDYVLREEYGFEAQSDVGFDFTSPDLATFFVSHIDPGGLTVVSVSGFLLSDGSNISEQPISLDVHRVRGGVGFKEYFVLLGVSEDGVERVYGVAVRVKSETELYSDEGILPVEVVAILEPVRELELDTEDISQKPNAPRVYEVNTGYTQPNTSFGITKSGKVFVYSRESRQVVIYTIQGYGKDISILPRGQLVLSARPFRLAISDDGNLLAFADQKGRVIVVGRPATEQ